MTWSNRLVSIALLTLPLAGCGGGGGEISSVPPPPPPPTPTPTAPTAVSSSGDTVAIPSPATRPGTYDAIALIEHGQDPATYRLAAPSEVKITTYQVVPNFVNYTIDLSSPDLPGGKSSLTASFEDSTADELYRLWIGDRATITYRYSDGSEKTSVIDRPAGISSTDSEPIGDGKSLSHQLYYSVGLSYVSLGEWMWQTYLPNGNATDQGRAYFVHGDRTPATEIPISGIATYSAASLGYDTDAANRNFPGYGAPVRVALSADFGRSSISAQLSRDSWVGGDSVGGTLTTVAIDAHGTGTINSPGDFSIPLYGTIGFPGQVSGSISANFAATGSLNGAFFGPGAQQVGGVFVFGDVFGHSLVSDAFVGIKN